MKKFIVTAAVVALGFLGAGAADAYYTYTGGILTVGSTGTAVMNLQTCLAELGNNPSSNVDGIYGRITANAVMQFQMDHNMNNNPDILVDGIVGPQTGPLYTAACAAEYASDLGNDSDDMDEDDDSSNFDINEGEEADFSNVDVDDADDDTIEEGADRAVLAEIEFELEDEGAALLERFDVVLDYVGGDSADEDDAWEVFQTLYLAVDGDVIAEEDADDEDDWDDSTEGDETRFRMSGINYAFEADEEYTLTVHADIAGSIDLGSNELSEWEFTLLDNGMRFVDEAGITLYLDEESPATDDTASFTIEEEGQDDELDVRTSSDDPDSTSLKVEDDESSDEYTVFVFELEADEDSSDLDIDKVGFTINNTGSNSDLDGSADYNDIVNDEMIVIDGEEFDDVTVTIVSPTEATLVFDVDEDFTIDSGETVDVELVLEFKAANGTNYAPGATIQAEVSSDANDNGVADEDTDVTAEGADDVLAQGSAIGDSHELLVEGITTEMTDSSQNLVSVDNADNDIAEFEIEFEVEAFEEDAYIGENVTEVSYSILNSAGERVGTCDVGTSTTESACLAEPGSPVFTPAEGTASLASSATQEGTRYRINEGDSESFTLSVSFQPGEDGSFRLRLDSVDFYDVNSGGTAVTYATLPVEDYRTGFVNIID